MSPKHRKPHVPWDSPASEPEPREMCATAGKRKYASEADAQATARHQMQQNQSATLQLRTYRCLYCNAWHLTKDA